VSAPRIIRAPAWLRRSLRARVFFTTAVSLAAATALAGILSRRATLVEERQVVGPRPASTARIAEQASTAYRAGGWPAVNTQLAGMQNDTGTAAIVVDQWNHVVAASAPELLAAQVKAATNDGLLSIRVSEQGTVASLEVRGVPPQDITARDGTVAGRIFQMPGRDAVVTSSLDLVPGWLVAVLLTGGVAIAITLLVSNRFLRPVRELTHAARRMATGDLDARVRAGGEDELGRLAAAFNVMAERVSANERTKRQMVSDVAHELRSPVTNLRCTLEAMQDGLVPATPAQIDVLHHETLLLQRLIADLQDLALADAGGLTLQFAMVDLEALARRAAGAGDGHQVVVKVEANARQVRADPGRLEQILRNLLENARRHTPAGGGIRVDAVRDGDRVRVAVSDTGEGIPPEHLPRVFERFYRAEPSRDRASGGAGLGLAVVRRLVEAHGGDVQASSPGRGGGATFTFSLPAVEECVGRPATGAAV
jgi:signal transduction histidine kinase